MKMQDAVKTVTRQIAQDPELYYAYQANIAMAFKDEYARRQCKHVNKALLHTIANNAAKNFLNLWIQEVK